MSWLGHLTLSYHRQGDQTLASDRHEGPLRVLKRLYPEGPGVCHHVLVHPPGGVVGGDVLRTEVRLEAQAHALITTPSATRFYRSSGPVAQQHTSATLAPGARLEWLPLEALAYRGCVAENHMRFELAPGAEMIGWDVLALGLPTASEAFDDPAQAHGRFSQHIELPGVWLERACIQASDRRLLDSPLGWAGRRVMGTLWLAAGQDRPAAQQDAVLEAARAQVAQASGALGLVAGVTSPHARVVVLRALGHRVEPVTQLLVQVWAAWRQSAWGMAPCLPRVWRT